MNFNFKQITALLLSVLILLLIVACKEKPNTESETQSGAESSAPANITFNVADEDDTKDPENIENTQIDDGAKVDFAEIQSKK